MTLPFPGGTRIILITKSNCATATCIQGVRPWAESAKATKSKTAKEAVDLYGKIFNKEAELRELFDEEKITEGQFLERRQQEVKPLFDNLHEWLLEKKNREILETSKTKQELKAAAGF